MDNVVSSLPLPKVFPKTNKNNAKTKYPKRKRTNKNGPKRNDRGQKRKMNNGYKNRESCKTYSQEKFKAFQIEKKKSQS